MAQDTRIVTAAQIIFAPRGAGGLPVARRPARRSIVDLHISATRVFRQVNTGLLNFRFERLAANSFTQPARMYRGRANGCSISQIRRRCFLHHQLGFLFPKS